MAGYIAVGRYAEVKTHDLPHLPYGVRNLGVEGVLNEPLVGRTLGGGPSWTGSGGEESLDAPVDVREHVIYRNGSCQHRVAADHLRVAVAGQEGLPGLLQFIGPVVIEEAVLEDAPELPCRRVKGGVVLVTIVQ
jgi:hypothetical protein